MLAVRLSRWAMFFALVTVVAAAPAAFSTPDAHAAGSVDRAIGKLRAKHDISKKRARWAKKTYAKALATRKKLKGKSRRKRAARKALNWQIRMTERMARSGKLTDSRVVPVFSQLGVNAAWFRSNGPRPYGTDRRFKGSRVIFQYFSGSGWQFHPLSNFAKLNAIWTVDTPPSRRAQRSYARELARWGVKRGKAVVWEYYFKFEGSPAPWISSISQGAAIQAYARIGYRFNNKAFTRLAKRGSKAFDVPAPRGLRLRRDKGFHYLGYSGNKRLIILNMFLQSIDAIHDFALITNDRRGRYLYTRGVDAARVETPKFDTGSWSLYALNGEKSDLHYHQLTITFLSKICKNTKEDVFCDTRDRFERYMKD